MKPAYLKSYGPNNVAIISMIFESFNAGMQFLTKNTDLEWKVKEMEDGTRCGFTPGVYFCDDEDKYSDFFNKIFTSWYFGCGGADAICLREVNEYGEALCGFDLD